MIFSGRFFISLCTLTGILFFYMILKKMGGKTISASWQYRIWYLLFFLLAMPFLPYPETFLSFKKAELKETFFLANQGVAQRYKGAGGQGNFSDYALNIEPPFWEAAGKVLFFLWLIGFLFMAVFFFVQYVRLFKIRREAEAVSLKWEEVLAKCQKEIGISKKIRIGKTKAIKSPMVFGIFSVQILLPESLPPFLSAENRKYILYHELCHVKQKDTFMNLFLCFFQAVYWFHPLVWLCFSHLRGEREILCDRKVLSFIGQTEYTNYGMTLIQFAQKMSFSKMLPLATDMGGSKKQLKKRILQIASFQGESLKLRLKSACVFLLFFTVIVMGMPRLSVLAFDGSYKKAVEKKSLLNLDSYFEGYTGSFVLYNKAEETTFIYNETESRRRVSPDSTYKIYTALAALEEGYISVKNNAVSWNGESYPFAAWEKNQTLDSAMKNSVNWYFENLNDAMGLSVLENYFHFIGYGNGDFSGGKDFWAESSLKISALEQVELLKKLYQNDFGFKEENVEAVKKALFLEERGNTRLFGKTGTGQVKGETVNGWFIGYVEKEENTIFFAVNVQGENGAGGETASAIALGILEDMEIYGN